MAEAAAPLDPSTRAALEKLSDIVMPPPPPFVPQTWGWAVLAVLLFALTAWSVLRWRHHREANRYRREALCELARIERDIDAGLPPGAAAAEIAPLIKRVALAAWPRARVASLAQLRLVDFLRTTEAAADIGAPLAALLNDIEYRSAQELATLSTEKAQACLAAARTWVEKHHVSA